ncbi:Transcription factor iws1 [Perkinsus olseni]|uniref:Transcription factor iws1 n=1 Tax=Perkinsus olseni TaxID=32597 RepID=A0A7J6N0U2_PEROL|nr:Transcription factor iws1 [Perkinsus olseni]
MSTGARPAGQAEGSPSGAISRAAVPSTSEESEGEDGEMGHSLEKKPRESKLLQPALDRLKKRRKRKEMDLGRKVMHRMEALVNSMYDASAADRDALTNGQPALAKLQMIEKVRGILVKQVWQEPFIEAGGLSAMADWLCSCESGASELQRAQNTLRFVEQSVPPPILTLLDVPKTSRVGWAVKDMYHHKDETTGEYMQVVEEQLIQHWLKLIQNQGNENRGNISRYIKATAEDMRQASRAIQKQKGPRLTAEQQQKVQSRRHAMIPNRGIALDATQPLSGAGTYRIQPVSNVEAAHKGEARPRDCQGMTEALIWMTAGGKSKKRSSKAVKFSVLMAAVNSTELAADVPSVDMLDVTQSPAAKSAQNSAFYWVMKLREEHQESMAEPPAKHAGILPDAFVGKASGQSTSAPSPSTTTVPSTLRDVSNLDKTSKTADADAMSVESVDVRHFTVPNPGFEDSEDVVKEEDTSDSSISVSTPSLRRPKPSYVSQEWVMLESEFLRYESSQAAYSARLHYERDRSRNRWVHPEWEERSLLRQKLLLKTRRLKGGKVLESQVKVGYGSRCPGKTPRVFLDEFTDPPFSGSSEKPEDVSRTIREVLSAPDSKGLEGPFFLCLCSRLQAAEFILYCSMFRHAFTEEEASEYALAIGKARLVTYHSRWGEYDIKFVSQLIDIAIYNKVIPSEQRVQHLAKKFGESSMGSSTTTST